MRDFWGTTIVLLIGVLILHTGTIRREEDPIAKTRTDPIKYEDKMNELKDGKKGAPSLSMRFYRDKKFLTQPPVEEEDSEESKDWEQYWTDFEAAQSGELTEGEPQEIGPEESENPSVEESELSEQAQDWWWDENSFKENGELDEVKK